MVGELRRFGVDVVGDLEELLPAAAPLEGPIPDDVTDEEIAPVAVETISAVLYRSHERETAGLRAEVERQREALARRATRVRQLEARSRHLEKGAKAAWQAYDAERRLALWRRAARRMRSAMRLLSPSRDQEPTRTPR
jgi:hypothetical protein